MRFLLYLSLTVFFFSCGENKEKADLLIKNAKIYTVDKNFNIANEVVVKDKQIIAIGKKGELENQYIATDTYDLEGKYVYPGLIDAHCHFYRMGLDQSRIDLVGTKSYQDVLDKVVAFQKEKNLPFLKGSGWDQNDWDKKEFPTNEELSKLFPDIPVVLERIDGHAYLVNEKALQLAKITTKTSQKGGAIEQKNGKLTGILIDRPMELVDAIIPEPTLKQKEDALTIAEDICFSYGLTTVDDAGLDKEIIDLIGKMQTDEALKIRMYVMVSNTPANIDHYLSQPPLKTDLLNVRSIKVYGDGALGSRGAALKEEYHDKKGHFGAMVTPIDEIEALAHRIASTDFQMNSHAIGDSANIVILKAYVDALKGKEDRRWRVEHAQVVDTNDFHFFSKNILPSVQPTHATSDMYWAEERLGHHRMDGAYAFKSLLDRSGMVALGTDFPIEQVNPFLTFYAAVSRQDLKQFPEEGFRPNEKLSRKEALKGMTIWAAYSNFEEKEKGSIEVGKWADFVVLEDDIMEVDISKIPNTEVMMTFVGGELVYKK